MTQPPTDLASIPPMLRCPLAAWPAGAALRCPAPTARRFGTMGGTLGRSDATQGLVLSPRETPARPRTPASTHSPHTPEMSAPPPLRSASRQHNSPSPSTVVRPLQRSKHKTDSTLSDLVIGKGSNTNGKTVVPRSPLQVPAARKMSAYVPHACLCLRVQQHI